jgi:hypothetical protein
MRLLLFILGICAGSVALGNRAEAQNYPWCGAYRDGVMICSFSAMLGHCQPSWVLHTKQHIPNIAQTTSVDQCPKALSILS